jgi:hypothetical protein
MSDNRYLSCTISQLPGERPWMRLAYYGPGPSMKPANIVEMYLGDVEDAVDDEMWVQMALARACDAA